MIVFNDRGNPSSAPCGATVLGLCASGDYDAWYVTASGIAAQMKQVDDERAVAWLKEFFRARNPDSIFVSFLPTDQTNALARWTQIGVDLLEEMGEQGIAGAKVPPSVTRNDDLPSAPGEDTASDVFKGVLILGGVIAVTAVAVAIIKK